MKIQYDDLDKIFQLLLNELYKNNSCCEEINFHYDFYWSVPVGKRQDVYNRPELDMGSIEHDLERIHKCILNNEPLPAHFRWLGNVLIAIADSIEDDIAHD